MPATIKKVGDLWRLIEKDTGDILTTAKGAVVDNGGHAVRGNALAQAAAVNNSRQDSGRAF